MKIDTNGYSKEQRRFHRRRLETAFTTVPTHLQRFKFGDDIPKRPPCPKLKFTRCSFILVPSYDVDAGHSYIGVVYKDDDNRWKALGLRGSFKTRTAAGKALWV